MGIGPADDWAGGPTKMTLYPVFDANRHDADKVTLSRPVGHAETPEQAMEVVRNFFAARVDDGGDPITIYAVELETVGNVTGYFPVWQ